MAVKDGSQEFQVYSLVPAEGIPQAELMKKAGGVGKIGFSKAMSAGWITLDKSNQPPLVKRKVDSVKDVIKETLAGICSGNGEGVAEKERTEMRKRKLVHEIIEKVYTLVKGPNFTTSIQKVRFIKMITVVIMLMKIKL